MMGMVALGGSSKDPPEWDAGAVRLLQRPDLGLFAIAHGLGASALAAEVTLEVMQHAAEAACLPARTERTAESVSTLLSSAIQDAQAAWAARVGEDPRLAGIGSTLVAGIWMGGGLTVAHLGDCAALVLRDGAVVHRTLNHTLRRHYLGSTGQDLGAGNFDGVIVRAIGMDADPEIQTWALAPHDVVLFSTGVHDLLSEADLGRLCCADPGELVRRVMREAGSRDHADSIAALAFRGDG